MEITELFCRIDDATQSFLNEISPKTIGKIKRNSRLSLSEIITILIYFQISSYKDFKDYYIKHVSVFLRKEFPNLVSYNRFVELIPRAILPMFYYLQKYNENEKTGIYFIDSTTLKVCDNHRIHSHKVFKGLAKRGKSSMGWFFGFKLHLVCNEKGQIMSFMLSNGAKSDQNIGIVTTLCKGLAGKLFGDRGYISHPLFETLFHQGLHLITKIKKNMKNKLMQISDKLLLRKRAIIESINDQLKNIFVLEHSRHRSPINFIANLLACLLAYNFKEVKPSVKFNNGLLLNEII